MADSLAIVWSDQTLNLKNIPSEGEWYENLPSLIGEEMECPTRTSRIRTNALKKQMVKALRILSSKIQDEDNVWFFVPKSWVFQYSIECPDFSTEEEKQDHLAWEVSHRLSSDQEKFRTLFLYYDNANKYEAIIIREELLEYITTSTQDSDIKLSGICVEPENKGVYLLNPNHDLRKSITLKTDFQDISKVPTKSILVPIVGAGAILALIAVIILYYQRPDFQETPASDQSELTSLETATTTTSDTIAIVSDNLITAIDSIEKVATIPVVAAVQKKTATIPTLQKVDIKPPPVKQVTETPTRPPGRTPFGLLLNKLPENANLRSALFSPVDMRIELTGDFDAERLLQFLRTEKHLEKLRIAGEFHREGIKFTVFQLENTFFVDSSGKKDLRKWQNFAKNSGLVVNNRTANGELDKTLEAIESLWDNMYGYSKLYLSSSPGIWTLTIQ